MGCLIPVFAEGEARNGVTKNASVATYLYLDKSNPLYRDLIIKLWI